MAGVALSERAAGQAVESFQQPGQGPGTFKRWIGMGGAPMTAEDFVGLAQESYTIGRGKVPTEGRIMAKGLVVPGAAELLVNGLREENPLTIEAVFPVPGRGGEDMSFVIAAANGPDRGGAIDPAQIRRRVDVAMAGLSPRSPIDSVELAAAHVDLVPYIPVGLEDSLVDLWGPRFGWTRAGVLDLQADLERQAALPPHERTKFATFAVKHEEDGARIVGGSDVEGREFDGTYVGEESEWGADPAERGKRIGEAVVVGSKAQALRARGGMPHVLFAELNVSANSEREIPPAVRVGIRTGLIPATFAAPYGESVKQILPQHVGVGDDIRRQDHEMEMEEGPLGERRLYTVKSFLVASLTPWSERTLYGPREIDYMHGILDQGERRVTNAGYPRARARQS